MRRDMDLIRELLLRLEAMEMPRGGIAHIPADDEVLAVPGFTVDQIDYHLSQINKSGFIDDGNFRPMDGIGFRCLTPYGHDFVDSIRDPDTWERTKKGALAAGGWTLDLVLDIAKGVIKKKIEGWSGVQL